VTGYFVTDLADPGASWSADLHLVDAFGFVEPSSPAVSDDGFFLADGNTLFAYPIAEPAGCFNPIVGQPLRVCPAAWSRTFGAGLTRPTLSGDDQLLLVGDAGHVWALRASDGAEAWSGRLPTDDAPSASPSVDDGHVFVPAAGRLAVFDRQGCGTPPCDPVWTADTGGTVSTQAAVAGGVVYTATENGMLRAFPAAGCGASTCPPLWEHDLQTPVTGTPTVSLGRLFVGTADGRLISFAPRAGR
jgi:outer membrane protein assembly factor BamB